MLLLLNANDNVPQRLALIVGISGGLSYPFVMVRGSHDYKTCAFSRISVDLNPTAVAEVNQLPPGASPITVFPLPSSPPQRARTASLLCSLLNLALLIVRQHATPVSEVGNVFRVGAHKEVNQVCLGLVVALSRIVAFGPAHQL